MSDPEVPQPERRKDVDDVVGDANAGLDAAAAAGADVPASKDNAADPDLAAFEEAERAHPGTFGGLPEGTPAAHDGLSGDDVAANGTAAAAPVTRDAASTEAAASQRTESDRVDSERTDYDRTDYDRNDYDRTERSRTESADADVPVTSIYDSQSDAETRIMPSEPVVAATPAALQPIFVQAPEPPQERGNRGTAGLIGLLATLVFAILFLGIELGLGAISGDVTGENLGEAALAPLTTWGFWTPVVVFFLGFWFLGALINRGRWGLWVILGLLVGVVSYLGYILGQLFEAPFWLITASDGAALVGEQLFSPLAIAAFVLGRELTIWFGAWVARIGARKTELNAEAQREYERTLEAGPTLSR